MNDDLMTRLRATLRPRPEPPTNDEFAQGDMLLWRDNGGFARWAIKQSDGVWVKSDLYQSRLTWVSVLSLIRQEATDVRLFRDADVSQPAVTTKFLIGDIITGRHGAWMVMRKEDGRWISDDATIGFQDDVSATEYLRLNDTATLSRRIEFKP